MSPRWYTVLKIEIKVLRVWQSHPQMAAAWARVGVRHLGAAPSQCFSRWRCRPCTTLQVLAGEGTGKNICWKAALRLYSGCRGVFSFWSGKKREVMFTHWPRVWINLKLTCYIHMGFSHSFWTGVFAATPKPKPCSFVTLHPCCEEDLFSFCTQLNQYHWTSDAK